MPAPNQAPPAGHPGVEMRQPLPWRAELAEQLGKIEQMPPGEQVAAYNHLAKAFDSAIRQNSAAIHHVYKLGTEGPKLNDDGITFIPTLNALTAISILLRDPTSKLVNRLGYDKYNLIDALHAVFDRVAIHFRQKRITRNSLINWIGIPKEKLSFLQMLCENVFGFGYKRELTQDDIALLNEQCLFLAQNMTYLEGMLAMPYINRLLSIPIKAADRAAAGQGEANDWAPYIDAFFPENQQGISVGILDNDKIQRIKEQSESEWREQETAHLQGLSKDAQEQLITINTLIFNTITNNDLNAIRLSFPAIQNTLPPLTPPVHQNLAYNFELILEALASAAECEQNPPTNEQDELIALLQYIQNCIQPFLNPRL